MEWLGHGERRRRWEVLLNLIRLTSLQCNQHHHFYHQQSTSINIIIRSKRSKVLAQQSTSSSVHWRRKECNHLQSNFTFTSVLLSTGSAHWCNNLLNLIFIQSSQLQSLGSAKKFQCYIFCWGGTLFLAVQIMSKLS